jgi:hypothetical protein
MLRDNENRREINRASRLLLERAEVGDRLPTPVEDAIAAADLTRGDDDLFAAETLAEAPSHIRAAVSGLLRRGKVHAVLDRRRRKVHVNPTITNAGRRRFRALHEVGHAILPSQNAPAHADNQRTLSPLTKIVEERDANQVSSELLFQRRRFTEMAAEYEVGLSAVVDLANLFEGSIHAALRRYVEFHRLPLAAVVLDPSRVNVEVLALRRNEAICSPAWEKRFERPDCWPRILEAEVFPWIATARHAGGFIPVKWEGRWPDRDNRMTPLHVEVISNQYKLLALLWRPKRQLLKRRSELVLPSAV